MRVYELDRARHDRDRCGGELADHGPVEPGGGVDRQHADRHRVVPGKLVVPEEQPGDGEGQGRLDRGQSRYRVRQAPEHQRGQDQERDADYGRRRRRQLMPERDGDELVERVRSDLALAARQRAENGRADPHVGGHCRDAGAGRGGGERRQRAAQCPGQRQPEQQVRQHEVGGDADEQPGGERPCHPAAGVVRPQQGEAEQGRGRRQHVEMPARQQRPDQQRVDRPEQVRPGPAGRVGPQQPVQADRHGEERDPVPQLQPEDDPRRRGAAQLGRGPLLGGGQRSVQRWVLVPGEMRQAADRITDLVQFRRGHHVGVVAEHGDPAVGGVADRVRRAGRRQDHQNRDGDRRHRHQEPRGIPRSASHRDQPGDHPAPAEQCGRPQAQRHEFVRQTERKLDRQRAGWPGHHRNRQAVPSRRRDDDDEDRAADTRRCEPAERYQPGRHPRWLSMASPDCGHLSVRYPAGRIPNLARTGRKHPYAASVYDPWCGPRRRPSGAS